MYDDIIHLAMDQQLLTEIRERDSNYKKLPLWRELQKNDSTDLLEQQLADAGALTFENVFREPVGYHLMKSFLRTEHSVDKAVFIADVNIYKTLQDPRARENVSAKIYEQFCAPEDKFGPRNKGMSVFRRHSNDEEDSKGISCANMRCNCNVQGNYKQTTITITTAMVYHLTQKASMSNQHQSQTLRMKSNN